MINKTGRFTKGVRAPIALLFFSTQKVRRTTSNNINNLAFGVTHCDADSQ
jgi:hypothetical protein